MENQTHLFLERIAIALEQIAKNFYTQNEKLQAGIPEIQNDKKKKKEKLISMEQLASEVNPIISFLTSRNIEVKSFKQEDEIDAVLDNLALFMGNNYNNLELVYNKIKSKLDKNIGFKIDLKSLSPKVVSTSCQFCKMLFDIAFLSEYRHFKSPQFFIQGKVNRNPKAINFLTGQWLERFIKTEISNCIEEINPSLQYSFIVNPQIILPKGNHGELDILYMIENEIFWFEAKTGDFQNYIDRYAQLIKIMGIKKEWSYLVLTEADQVQCENLSKIFDMEVVSIELFSTTIKKSITKFNLNFQNHNYTIT